ncbi:MULTISPECIES: Gfo/Idh/MocA family oxidoreductase [unclassified Devosia]|jgi:predicted dehydrogenase|uniref:Gfo/Idh/MocA family protein n=1 Tax=unclassified Devosia TaxID=196773 RepID=UPI000FD8E926|nr:MULTISPECIES: Gfo/Idh/MocA family oxidoreductase [unclassified Devosia]MDF2797829.1 putative dehydrogenase [Devosia sp.]
MIGVGVIGYGYWGPNLVRNFSDIPSVDLRWVCDLQTERLARLRLRYPAVSITEDLNDVLSDPKVDAVAIATPVSTHFDLAMRALRAGKSVFVEKPITATAEQAERLIEEADRRGLVVAVDHTFIHTGAVKKLREVIQKDLGQVYYYDSVRVNLGLFQHDVSVVWDLAVHDLSIMDYVLGVQPRAVSATGIAHIAGSPENMAYLNLHFDTTLMAHIHVNWLAPVKVRRTLVGGSNKMVVYDDLEPSEKIKVYDSGITLDPMAPRAGEQKQQMRIGYRAGDMFAPKLDITEALGSELAEFIACVQRGTSPTADGVAGLRVVRILEAATRSMAQGGTVIELAPQRVLA